ncbi:MAG: DUF4350 domain-containing protein [Candidatus Thiodiazotropha sp. L084R]
MQGNRMTIAVVLALLTLVAALGWLWFEKNFEKRTTVTRSAMGEEATRNPLLAAEMFLDRLGLEVQSQSGRVYLLQPPEDKGLLFVRDLGPPLPPTSVDNLLTWVEQGGHLVASPSDQHEEGRPDPLLQKFGVSLVSLDEDEEEFERGALLLPNQFEGLEVDFDQQRWFEIDADFVGVSPLVSDSQFMVFPWGEGQVTLISDSEVFTNQQISEFDHARLMAHFAPERGRAWLLYSAQMPSLFSLIWRWVPYLVLTIVTLLLLTIWRMTQSSGPKLAVETTARRDLLEHLQASAEFAWRNDQKSGLLEGARHQVEKRWLSAHPVLIQLDQQARCDWIAKHTGLTSSAIYQTLYPNKGDSAQLIKNTVNLQRLLAALHPDRKVK